MSADSFPWARGARFLRADLVVVVSVQGKLLVGTTKSGSSRGALVWSKKMALFKISALGPAVVAVTSFSTAATRKWGKSAATVTASAASSGSDALDVVIQATATNSTRLGERLGLKFSGVQQ